eukprot:5521957-Pyramimonas_sp.AAC.1
MQGCSPERVLKIDALHAVYLGVVLRFLSCVLWNTIDGEVWNVSGPRAAAIEMSIRCVELDIQRWYKDVAKTPRENQLRKLAPKMVGSDWSREAKLKAAEAGSLLPCALSLRDRFAERFPFSEELSVAGAALQEWLTIARNSPRVIQPDRRRRLLACA